MKKILKILIISLLLVTSVTGCIKPSEDQVREKMEKALLKEYGEEFVVENIGLRDANGEKFYQASIYPKSIIGTPKENDNYYRAEAVVDLKRFYAENSVGDTYGEIKMNDEAEEFLLPKAKELFGEKVRVVANIKYEVLENEDFYSQYFVSGFIDKRDKALKNPNTQRIVSDISIYIFDKIDNSKEKEERKKEIFGFIQYLKKEGLFEYLRLYVYIVDERSLTNSYPNYREKQSMVEENTYVKKFDVYMDLPPESFKKEVTEALSKEIKNMSNEELLKNMNNIPKSDLEGATWEGFIGGTTQYFSQIESEKRLKLENVYDELSNEEKERINYNYLKDVLLEDLYHRYIFLKEE